MKKPYVIHDGIYLEFNDNEQYFRYRYTPEMASIPTMVLETKQEISHMKKFYIVANFGSSQWMMSQTKQHATEQEALQYAKELSGRHPSHVYHVLTATHAIAPATPPIKVSKLT